jgi:putative flavoprotein involved in K+ transport
MNQQKGEHQMRNVSESYDTIVIGGGQAGLATGYYLQKQGHDFVILDASQRTGDAWRRRWDSLRLFTPAWHNGLPGMPFPAAVRSYYPTKDEMADYLEAYAAQFALPLRTGVRVTGVFRESDGFIVASDGQRFQADNVVVAMSNYQRPKTPAFAGELDPAIVQLHSGQYRTPSQLRDGDALVVGAGNSGAEIALDVANGRRVWLAGNSTGHVPFRIEGFFGRRVGVPLVMFAFHYLLSLNTPMGRKLRPKMRHHGGPLVRTKPGDLDSAGVERLPRIAGVRDGLPVLEDGRALEASNVIWCTGFGPDYSWIDLPVFQEDGYPREECGVVPAAPGLFFVGLSFQQAASSTLIGGVGRDAEHIARQVAARSGSSPSATKQTAATIT